MLAIGYGVNLEFQESVRLTKTDSLVPCLSPDSPSDNNKPAIDIQ